MRRNAHKTPAAAVRHPLAVSASLPTGRRRAMSDKSRRRLRWSSPGPGYPLVSVPPGLSRNRGPGAVVPTSSDGASLVSLMSGLPRTVEPEGGPLDRILSGPAGPKPGLPARADLPKAAPRYRFMRPVSALVSLTPFATSKRGPPERVKGEDPPPETSAKISGFPGAGPKAKIFFAKHKSKISLAKKIFAALDAWSGGRVTIQRRGEETPFRAEQAAHATVWTAQRRSFPSLVYLAPYFGRVSWV